MNSPVHEIFALRVGSNHQRTARENFFFDACCGPPNALMPLDYYFWVVRSADKTVVVDTCFPRSTAERRQRLMYRDTAQALAALDVDCMAVTDVVITHLHWDHAGCIDLFPNARFHVQKDELQFCTGPAMRHRYVRKTYEEFDVHRAVAFLYSERVVTHDGDSQLLPGLSLHKVGGHTPGSQVVRISTQRGAVVLASDAVHLWANIRQRSPFPIVQDVVRMLDAFETIEQLADGPEHVIPGHDPQVARVFPRWRDDEHIFALHMEPIAEVEA
ncbi:N-acyl homoserine lactonase family protein [Azotobacter chroococcum]|uniref:N-acyl homoserine lactonase family protein n=1 Tax=Azotobacter chroococcum TaxID=353 RepID=UPI001A94EEBC|nr:N-acyl homoserine lactonase family protein [Azotobacter chroococcum]